MKFINKGHAVVAKAASTDETRFVINSVYLEETPKGMRVVATDGRMLAMVEDVDPKPKFTSEDFPTNVIPHDAPNGAKCALVPTRALTDAVKSINKKKGSKIPVLNNVALVMGQKVTTLATTDLESPKVTTASNVEGNFPNYQQVIPKSDAKNFAIGFSPEILGRALAIAKDFGLFGVKMEFTSPLNPVKITGTKNGQDLTIVVMPMRI